MSATQVLVATLDDERPIAVRCLALSPEASKADFKRFDKHMRARRWRAPSARHVVKTLGAFVDWQVCSPAALGIAWQKSTCTLP